MNLPLSYYLKFPSPGRNLIILSSVDSANGQECSRRRSKQRKIEGLERFPSRSSFLPTTAELIANVFEEKQFPRSETATEPSRPEISRAHDFPVRARARRGESERERDRFQSSSGPG